MMTTARAGAYMFLRATVFTVVAAAVLSAPLAGVARGGIVVEQRSNGLPGKGGGDTVEQTLTVGEGTLRLDDKGSKRYLIVRLDKGVIWEVDPQLKLYTEAKFEWFREKREQAYAEKEATRKAILRKSYDAALKERYLRDVNVREDGEIVVRIERGPRERVNGYDAEKVAIWENWKPIIEVWVTRDLEKEGYQRPKEIFDFYDKVGLFHPKVVEKLKEIEGFPVKLFFEIDLVDAGASVRTDVLRVAERNPPASEFELPAGFQIIEELPDVPVGGPAAADFRCPVCGAVVDPAKGVQGVGPFRKLWFDSQEHWDRFLEDPDRYKAKKP